ncbi:hypothetical protein KC360_g52 [Hortaea werneckii]|nr:hypothetical protein KC344_g50 [Hortaea werneckii]KAI7180499.1 hypothetical protein KC360_g52 [Hortaea werneckii]
MNLSGARRGVVDPPYVRDAFSGRSKSVSFTVHTDSKDVAVCGQLMSPVMKAGTSASGQSTTAGFQVDAISDFR